MELARKAVLKAKVFYQDLKPIVTIDEALKKNSLLFKPRIIKKEETIDERLVRESGVVPVVQDHPIYKRKPSIRFISKKTEKKNE